MRTMFTAAMLAAAAYSQNFVSDADQERTVLSSFRNRTGFGAELIENIYEDVTEKILNFPFDSYARDYEQQADFIERVRLQHLEAMRQKEQFTANGEVEYDSQPIYKCDDRAPEQGETGFGMFLPILAAETTHENPDATFEGKCFKNITMNYEKVSNSKVILHLDFQEPKSWSCTEAILFANTEILHMDMFFRHGKHKL